MKGITPWDFLGLVSKQWKWMAKNRSGLMFLYSDKPVHIEEIGGWGYPKILRAKRLLIDMEFDLNIEWPSYDWRECIVQRDVNPEEWVGKIVITENNEMGKLIEYIGGYWEWPYVVERLVPDMAKIYAKSVRPLTEEEKELLA